VENIKIERAWWIRTVLPGRRRALIKVWKPETDVWLVGARIILLCDEFVQRNLDLYGCVSLSPKFHKTSFVADCLKKDHLFYGQRDAYSRCSGMSDLIHSEFLPFSYGFFVNIGTPVYLKGLAVNGNPFISRFDVLIDLFYIENRRWKYV